MRLVIATLALAATSQALYIPRAVEEATPASAEPVDPSTADSSDSVTSSAAAAAAAEEAASILNSFGLGRFLEGRQTAPDDDAGETAPSDEDAGETAPSGDAGGAPQGATWEDAIRAWQVASEEDKNEDAASGLNAITGLLRSRAPQELDVDAIRAQAAAAKGGAGPQDPAAGEAHPAADGPATEIGELFGELFGRDAQELDVDAIRAQAEELAASGKAAAAAAKGGAGPQDPSAGEANPAAGGPAAALGGIFGRDAPQELNVDVLRAQADKLAASGKAAAAAAKGGAGPHDPAAGGANPLANRPLGPAGGLVGREAQGLGLDGALGQGKALADSAQAVDPAKADDIVGTVTELLSGRAAPKGLSEAAGASGAAAQGKGQAESAKAEGLADATKPAKPEGGGGGGPMDAVTSLLGRDAQRKESPHGDFDEGDLSQHTKAASPAPAEPAPAHPAAAEPAPPETPSKTEGLGGALGGIMELLGRRGL